MADSGILAEIDRRLPVGSKLDPNYLLTGIRSSRGELAVFYSIPSKTTEKRSQKAIVGSEFNKALQHLQESGQFTREWFGLNLPKTASQSTSCSFKVIGEIFVALGKAERVKVGRGYRYVALRG